MRVTGVATDRTGLGLVRLTLLAAVAALSACGGGGDGAPPPSRASGAAPSALTPAAHVPPAPALPVDSYFPPEEALRRFRQGIGERPSRFTGGAPSRDSLVRRLMQAVETRDAAAVNAMIVSRAEFAYLYYPTHPLREPPYELDPQMMWFQLRTQSEKGISRLFERLGGRPLRYLGHTCPNAPVRHGGNRMWEVCVVRHAGDVSGEVAQRLFGPIVERDGVYKFVGYGNDF